MPFVRRASPVVWSVLLALLVLGPGLGRGVVLSYDMVWVPHLAMRPDFLGLGSALPRAVPSDAVVAVLDDVVPGELLQKLVLLGALVGAGTGILRLVPDGATVGRLVAVTVYQWNPLVDERLVIGHWPLLLGYAALPWVIEAARSWRRNGAFPPRLLWLVPVGSLSASTGLVTGVALVVFVIGGARPSRGRVAAAAGVLLCANAPWLVAGVLHAGAATVSGASARVFALAAEGAVPAPLAALGLGGIWNSEVVPTSHLGLLGWLWLLALGALVLLGALARRGDDRRRLAVCWAAGYAWALLTWVSPTLVAALAAHVPGGGLLRDGARTLVLCAPLVAVLAGQGATAVSSAAPAPARPGLLVALVLIPLTLLPDAAFGVAGWLRPTSYPADWDRAADVVTTGHGDVLVLPLSSYRQPTWNHGHKVLDPIGRLLRPDYLASDQLVVGGVDLAGEDPRVRRVAKVLATGSVVARRRGLARMGLGWVVVETDAAGPRVPALGSPVLRTSTVTVYRVPAARTQSTSPARRAVLLAAFGAFVASVLVGLLTCGFGGARRLREGWS